VKAGILDAVGGGCELTELVLSDDTRSGETPACTHCPPSSKTS